MDDALRSAGSGGDHDRLVTGKPGGVDLVGAVDQVGRDAQFAAFWDLRPGVAASIRHGRYPGSLRSR